MAEAFNCADAYSWSGPGEIELQSDILYESGSGEGSPFYATDEEPDTEPANDDSSDEEILYSSDDSGRVRPPQKRARYNTRRSERARFLGQPVCCRALLGLLGVGGSTLQKLRHGEAVFTNKCRRPLPKHPTFGFTLRADVVQVWEHIVMYFYHVYHSSAEVMPTNWYMVKSAGTNQLETPFPEDLPDAVQKAEDLQRLVNSIGRTLNTFSMDIQSQLIGPGTFCGPRRCLQHCTRTDLYWEYRAFCQSRSINEASYSSFMRIANAVMKPGLRDGHLRFRKPGEHAQCDYCFQTRDRMRAAKGEQAKIAIEREPVRHQLAQWQDRQVYWAFRSLSQTFFTDTLANTAELLGAL